MPPRLERVSYPEQRDYYIGECAKLEQLGLIKSIRAEFVEIHHVVGAISDDILGYCEKEVLHGGAAHPRLTPPASRIPAPCVPLAAGSCATSWCTCPCDSRAFNARTPVIGNQEIDLLVMGSVELSKVSKVHTLGSVCANVAKNLSCHFTVIKNTSLV